MAIDREEIRALARGQLPARNARARGRGEDDICWGGRRWVFQSEAQKLWLERCISRGLTVPTWPKEYGGAGYSREDAKNAQARRCDAHPRPSAARQLRHLDARTRAAEIRLARSRRRRICRASRAAKSAGARAIRSPARARTSLRCAPRPRTGAIISSSTARRSGPPTPTRPTGFSASCAPIPPRSSRRAFPFS